MANMILDKKIFKAVFVIITIFLINASSYGQEDSPPLGTSSDGDRSVMIDFNDADIRAFIKFISQITGTNFIIDDKVKGKITIISPSKISVEEAYKVFESVLEVNNFTLVKSGEVVKIIPAPEARSKNIETKFKADAPSEDKLVTQVLQLKYADPNEIKRMLAPLVSKNSVVLTYNPTNTLIIADYYSNIKRLMQIIDFIDIQDLSEELTVLTLENADASKLAKTLHTVFYQRQTPQQPRPSMIRFVADERTNSIIIISNEIEANKIKELVKYLDKEIPKGKARFHVYYLQNAKAEELVKVLEELARKQSTTAPQQNPAEKAKAAIISESIKITADKATNSLIIMADKDDFQVLDDLIQKLDIPRSMVYIECLIMEVNVDKGFNFGTEWQVMGKSAYLNRDGGYGAGFGGGSESGYSNISGMITPNIAGVGSMPAGFTVGAFAEAIEVGGIKFPSLAAVIQHYNNDKDVNILSTPQLLTTNNEEAKISVGKNIPYLTKSGASTVESYNTYEYKDVGITLKITPNISQDRTVKLKIDHEITKLDQLMSSGDNRPTTLKRTFDTTVIVKDNNTVVIGGLIDDSFSLTTHKVPCLGDIPFFGWLFKSISNSNEKTNLFVFLTPHVIESPVEAQTIYELKKGEIERVKEFSIKLDNKDEKPETKQKENSEQKSENKNKSN
ncbi:MAG: type II secretion system secretin GspD [Desulfobacterales bacterium]|nr:type II secretion system secretin GspD [Desulfobacterales bacterium]